MINFPTQAELDTLTSFRAANCVTIYVPHIETANTNNPNRLELKNLLRQAEAALQDAGATETAITRTLRPGFKLVEDDAFWPARQEAMVLFMHPKFFRYYHLPLHDGPSLVSLGWGFNLEPLLKTIYDNQAYYVLSLSHNDVQLYKGDHYKLQPVQVEGFPVNMKQELNIDEYPKWRATHQIAPASLGKGAEASHGQYNVNQTDKNMLLEFFRRVDKRLHRLLVKEPLPLVIAGVGYLQPIYKSANTYPYLLPLGVRGNFEHVSTYALGEKAWQVIDRYRNARLRALQSGAP